MKSTLLSDDAGTCSQRYASSVFWPVLASSCKHSQLRPAARCRRFHLCLSKASSSAERQQLFSHLLFRHSFALPMRLRRSDQTCPPVQFARQQRLAHVSLACQTHLLFRHPLALPMTLRWVSRNNAPVQFAHQQRIALVISAYQIHPPF